MSIGNKKKRESDRQANRINTGLNHMCVCMYLVNTQTNKQNDDVSFEKKIPSECEKLLNFFFHFKIVHFKKMMTNTI